MVRNLRNATLRREVADLFLESIMQGKLRPGERIIQSKLARDLGVSHSALREGLLDLERQGLVTKEDRRFTRITSLDSQEIEDAYEMRLMFEPQAAVSASKNFTPEHFAKLESFLQEMREAGSRKEFAAYNRNDLAFHQLIWKLSGRKGIERALTAVATPVFSFGTIELSLPRPQADFNYVKNCEDHMILINTLKKGGPEEVRRVFEEKLGVFRKRYVDGLRKVQAQRAEANK